MNEWSECALYEVAEILDSQRSPVNATERAARKGDIPYYGASGQAGWIDSALFDEDLVLLGEDAIDFIDPKAQKAYDISGPSWVNNHAHVLRARKAVVVSRFLTLALNAVNYSNYVSMGTRSKLTQSNMRKIVLRIPRLEEQCRIVDVASAVDAQMSALIQELGLARHVYLNATSLLWLTEDGTEAPHRTLGRVMRLDVERQVLDPDHRYASAGVLGAGGGLLDKGTFLGAETSYAAMNVLRTNQVVMRKLTAWEGPITVVPPAFDGYVASNEFPTFTLSSDVIPQWMRHVCRTRRLWDEMKNRVTGTVQRRKRLSPEQLLDVSLPLPSRAAQERSASALDSLDAELSALGVEISRLRTFRSSLLASLLNQDIEIPESYDALLDEVS